ncbi:MAG: class I SAM-dependent methyltransferase [Nitrospirota bacterium]
MSRYASRLESLQDLFGTGDVCVEPDRLRVNGLEYPIEDEVVLLDGGRLSPDAAEIQATFGAEWKCYDGMLPDYERQFAGYFDLVPFEALKQARVCDLGCGMGRWSYLLKRRCRELVLVDFCDAIFQARRLLDDAPALFFRGDIRTLPFRRHFADFALCVGVLHHLPEDMLQALRRIAHYAPWWLVFVYYALDNRPRYFTWLLRIVSLIRLRLSRLHSPKARAVLAAGLAGAVYLPLRAARNVARPFGLGRYVPLADIYEEASWPFLCHAAYDRFFTPIEQRVRRPEIFSLRDTFAEVQVSDLPPYWHFTLRHPSTP